MDQGDERLIEEVRKYEHLYNSSMKNYKDYQMSTNSWWEIAQNLALNSTCNVEQSGFNDWFSGHLNFQIALRVRALCKKHGLSYKVKTLGQGFADVVRSLKKSGDLWVDAYLHK